MRIVDINRIGNLSLAADEAWVMDPTSRGRGPTPRSSDIAPDPAAGPAGIRRQLAASPGPLAELEQRVRVHHAAGGANVVRLCPGPDDDDYPLEPWVLTPLPEYCEREDITVLVDPGVKPIRYPWSEIVSLAREHPHLVVVALAPPLAGPTAARALDAAPNLVLETSAVTDASTVDLVRLVEVAGAHRLAYGSGDRGIAASVVMACLPTADAPAVMAGNADLIDRREWGAAYL
jgi:hypothetical protein